MVLSGRLESKVVIVTGAAQGIGRDYAIGLAGQGATVVVGDIQEERAQEVATSIAGSGGSATAMYLDVTSDESTTECVEKTLAQFGRIDVLVNNAGLLSGLGPNDFMDIELDDWDRVMRVNVRGVWQASRAVIPAMRSAGGGRIINQASIAVWGSSLLHYAASKAAVVGITRSMAKLLGSDNITVNAIAPGLIGTEALIALAGGQEPIDRRVQMQALKRMGMPGDLVGTVTFLCSDEAAWMTGQVLVVDGGTVMA